MGNGNGAAPRRRGDPLYHTAVHEAGHAVVSWELGIPIRRVSIVPDGDSDGHLMGYPGRPWMRRFRLPKGIREEKNPELREFMEKAYRQSWEAENDIALNAASPRIREYLEKQIMLSFAGSAACSVMRLPNPGHGDGMDLHQVVQYFSRIAREGREETLYLDWLYERTKNILRFRRPSVAALAEELMEKRKVSGRHAHRVMLEALMAEGSRKRAVAASG